MGMVSEVGRMEGKILVGGERFGGKSQNFWWDTRIFRGVWVKLLILKRGLKGCSFE